jgi:hypothetical protein
MGHDEGLTQILHSLIGLSFCQIVNALSDIGKAISRTSLKVGF